MTLRLAARLLLARPRLGLAVLGLALVLCGVLAAPGSAWAQQVNPCDNPNDPDAINSKECICQAVDDFALVPMKLTERADPYSSPPSGTGGPVAYDGVNQESTTGRPVYNPATGLWVSHSATLPDLSVAPWGTAAEESADPAGATPTNAERPAYDLVLETNDRYNELCAFSYFRENLGRIWRFAVALGGVAGAISLAWGGVAYMQDSASMGDAVRVRMAMLRVILGMTILALALVIWNLMDAYLITHIESWSWEQEFYDFRGLHGGSER